MDTTSMARISTEFLQRWHSISRCAPPQFRIFGTYATGTLATHSSSPMELKPRQSPQDPRFLESWSGLASWRGSGSDERRLWGPGKHPEVPPANTTSIHTPAPASTLAECGRAVLLTPDPYQKAHLTHAAWQAFLSNSLPVGVCDAPPRPARPATPKLVPARQIPTFKQSTLPLNAYTCHNLAHVELNAIDLAWDTVVRFSALTLPSQFYADFARVADDESRHLLWCLQRLEELGCRYGCMPAHNLLWEGCEASAKDLPSRLAVVPMGQEARGLDAGGRLAEKLVGWGDNRSAAIVARIAEEERAHVAVGVSWFRAFAAAAEKDPGEWFVATVSELCPDLLRPPFNHDAREQVGLERPWYDASARSEALQGAVRNITGNEDEVVKEDDEERRQRMEALQRRLVGLLAQELEMVGHR